MNERLDFLRVFGGFVYLLLGGDLLVRGALGLSKRASISPVVVGLTVVAFGTSAPELLTSVYAGLNGFSGVAIGNIVGSNIANVLLVLGLPALIHPIFPRDRALRGQVLFMLGVSAAVVAVSHTGSIGNLEGLALLAVFAGAALVTLRGGVTMPGFDTEDAEEQLNRVLGLPHHPASIALLIALGCIMLPLGAHLTVEGSVAVAHSLGVTHASVGCIALGNVIGSNVFNILLIMGLTSALVEIPVPDSFLSLDLWVMLGVAGLLTLFVVQRRSLGRAWGAVFLGGYVAYLVVIL
jgi:cation:H+ antiporter